jgi:hypothetical protein
MFYLNSSLNQLQLLNSNLNDALQVYERRFGYTPDWLEDFTQGRVLALILQALKRGAPLTAADVLH